uniref:NADH-ubiquinone oxidoreductase chain 2 n=1 Tax=Lucidina sp. FM13 TaxID=2596686 RepID=A0A5C0PX67_9COLE|nr:NADH dehydrogenase subunit 2 [Lucidina sp. FM13]
MTKFWKITFISSLFMSTMIVISSSSWMSMWIGLEINMLSFIPLIIFNNKNSCEAAIKYFFTQAIASSSILLSIILMMTKNNELSSIFSSWEILIMNSSLLMKTGMAPFHFWFPEVMEGLEWLSSLLLLTWQKISPLAIIMFNMKFNFFFSIIIILSVSISSIMIINQTSIRKIMAYSSINHLSWMLSSMIINQTVWMIYFLIYSIMTMNIVLIFKLNNMFFTPQISLTWSMNPMMKLMFLLSIMSLAGIPPFIGFFPKWLIIQSLVEMKFYLITISLILMTLIMIFMYLNLIFSSLVLSSSKMKWMNNFSFKKNKLLIFSNSLIVLSLLFSTLLFN